MGSGLIVALNKTTGKPLWETKTKHYAWSSPVDVFDQNKKSWIIQADSIGQVFLINPKSGATQHKISYGANIEASPAVFNGIAVTATRGGQIIAFQIQ
jgi:outer membrane protein assembly factor BamB